MHRRSILDLIHHQFSDGNTVFNQNNTVVVLRTGRTPVYVSDLLPSFFSCSGGQSFGPYDGGLEKPKNRLQNSSHENVHS